MEHFERPKGFKLAGSPLGADPFDGIYEIKYKTASSKLEDDFYDYLFWTHYQVNPRQFYRNIYS